MYGGYAFCIMCHFRKQLIKWFSLKKHSLFFDKEMIMIMNDKPNIPNDSHTYCSKQKTTWS